MPDLRFWRCRQAQDDDVDRELEVHLELARDEQIERGVPPRQATLAARRQFGSVTLAKEELREMRTGAALDRVGRELRHAMRRLAGAPLFTLATVLTLALAIGANVAIFAVVYRVVVNPLPYGDSHRLIALDNGMPSRNIAVFNSHTTQLYYQYLDRARTLDGLAIHRTDDQTLTGDGNPERVRVTRTTSSLASVLRVAPAHGCWFTEGEGVPGAPPVAVLSHSLWIRRYGQNPGVLSRLVTLDGVPTTVIGVMPSSFVFPDPQVEAWTPLPLTRAGASDNYSFGGVARLREGSSAADARKELDRLAADLERTYPGGGYAQLVSSAKTLIEATVGRVKATLWTLLASVGLVLLVACANVANLFLVRSEAKQREIAVRRALGAGSGGVSAYFLAESAWLSIAGGGVGLALAWGAVHLLVNLGPANLPRLQEVRLDGVALAFTLALSILSGVACGSIPLLRLGPLAASLHESGRVNTASRSHHRVRQVLMGGQIALALVLLVSSGLLLRSFQKLRAIDPGFNATSALTFRVGLPGREYPDRRTMVAAHQAILDRLSSLPGVTAASAATCLPLEGCGGGGPLAVEGRILPRGTNAPIVLRRAVAGGFFETIGMRILRGRGIDRGDVERNEPIVVVNEALAKLAFPNQDPIGQRVRFGNPALSSGPPEWLTIAGVVAETPFLALGESTTFAQLYMPMFAWREVNLPPRVDSMSYVLRTAPPPATLSAAARRSVAAIDDKLALAQVRTLQDLLDGAAAQMAFTMILIVIAAGVSLLLGVVGIYGVTSYIVSRRTAEIGVRLALGARPGSVARMIVRQGGLVALAGVIAGLTTALVAGRLIESLLYGVSPRDPGVLAVTTLTLLSVALLACLLPARRAARLSPLEALRTD